MSSAAPGAVFQSAAIFADGREIALIQVKRWQPIRRTGVWAGSGLGFTNMRRHAPGYAGQRG